MSDKQQQPLEEAGEMDCAKKIVKQLMHYFGDINMSRDRYMKTYLQDQDGWVPFTELLKFRRLAKLTQNAEEIISAVQQSEDHDMLEISEDKKSIRRSAKYPIPEYETMKNDIMKRTLYIKGFPQETTTMDSLIEYFKDYNPENIMMKKYKDLTSGKWIFKGSIYVVFRTLNEAEKYYEEPQGKFEDMELLKMFRSMYIEEKKSMKELEKFIKQKNRNEEMLREANINLPLGATLMLTQITDELSKDDIKEAVQALGGHVAYIKIEGDTAWVRLKLEDTAQLIYDECKGEIHIKDDIIQCSVLRDMAEFLYLDEVKMEILKKTENAKKTNKNKEQKNQQTV